ncbi:MAG: ribosome maturation factor RimM [Ilumatobacteraceae bacterium]
MTASDRPSALLEIGHIRRPHGLRGDVYVQLVSDREGRLDPGSVLYTDDRTMSVVTSRTASNGRRIVHFDGVDDRNAAEAFTNVALYAPPIDDPDELWVHELIGRTVVDQHGVERGTCVTVVANPASDLLELSGGALVPSTFVVSNRDGVITVEVPEGLFDLG